MRYSFPSPIQYNVGVGDPLSTFVPPANADILARVALVEIDARTPCWFEAEKEKEGRYDVCWRRSAVVLK